MSACPLGTSTNGNDPTGSVYSSGGVIRSYCHNDSPADETDCGYSDAGKTFAAGQFPYWYQRLGGLFWLRDLKKCLNTVKKLGNDKIKLVLELTERNPIPVTPEARAIFDSLHQHNITFALDDFGTGYATYRYLQAFPVDFIKIDKSFVQMASVDEISGHIVDNIVELARKLWFEYRGGRGRNRGAGGFNDRQRRSLLQGYLYSPPVPGNKFISEWVMKAGG